MERAKALGHGHIDDGLRRSEVFVIRRDRNPMLSRAECEFPCGLVSPFDVLFLSSLDVCDSLKGETKMLQRNRDQKGTVVRIGNHWCVRYADWVITDDGQRIRKQGLTYKLSPVLQEHSRLKRPPEYVQELQTEFMERVNESLSSPQQCSTIAQFVSDVWMPYLEREGA